MKLFCPTANLCGPLSLARRNHEPLGVRREAKRHAAAEGLLAQSKAVSPLRFAAALQNRRAESAFTLVEIALAVAVIAFALVALVGLLPLGMEIQRDNRQDTIVNQDGTYLLEALRGRVVGMIDLVSYVDHLSKDGVTMPRTTSDQIIDTLRTIGTTNRALVRSIAGAAALRSPDVKDMAMRYQVTCVIRRADDPQSVPPAPDLPYRDALVTNLFTVRLVIEWPVLPTGQLVLDSPNRQVFRTVVAGVERNGILTTLFQ